MHFGTEELFQGFYFFEWFLRIVAILIIPRNRKPTSATAWLMMIMLFPTIGMLCFAVIGNPRLSRKRRAKQRVMDDIIDKAVKESSAAPQLRNASPEAVPERIRPFINLCTNLGRMPAVDGNHVEFLSDYQGSLDRIVRDINAAERFVHVEFYIIALDDATEPLFAAMQAAVARGVKVRVLYDALGSLFVPGYFKMKRRLDSTGAEWHMMLPLRLPGLGFTRPDLRNHRKIVIIDGQVGYTGSQNLVQRNYHRRDSLVYDELMARVEGPVVAQMHAVLISDWYSESGQILSHTDYPEIELTGKRAGDTLAQVLPSGPSFADDNNLRLFTDLIHAARRRVVVTNPYFVPDESLMVALTSAAQRGVETVLINSEIMDQRMVGHAQRSYYEELLKAGVKIYWYKKPVLLHAKHITIDDDIAIIGSSNMDMRSFQLDSEITLVMYDRGVVADLQKIEDQYLRKSSLVSARKWQNRPHHKQLFDNLARLTAALQ